VSRLFWAGLGGYLVYRFVGGGVLGRRLTAPVQGGITAGGWGDYRTPVRVHRGIDVIAPKGTPIVSALPGRVVAMKRVDGDIEGLMVAVESDGMTIRYLHMDTIKVSFGHDVDRGQLLGTVGETGNARGPHTHIDVALDDELKDKYIARYGEPNPLPSRNKHGWVVPAETVIPVTKTNRNVLAAAKARGVVVR